MKQLIEDEWSDRFVPAQDDDGNENVVEDYGDADPSLVWSCIDDDGPNDDRVIVSGIHPDAYAYWVCKVQVAEGEAYIVRIPEGRDDEDKTRPQPTMADRERMGVISKIADNDERNAAISQLLK